MPTISDRDLERLKQSVEELSALNQIAAAIDSSMPVQRITQTILEHCLKRVGAQQGAVYLTREESSDDPMFRTFVRAQEPDDKGLPIHLSKSLIGWMIGHRRVLAVNDMEADSNFQGIRFPEFGIDSLLVAPLLTRKGLTGVLALFNSTRTGGFTEADKRFLGIVGTQTAKVVEIAELREQEQQYQAVLEEMRLARDIQESYLPRTDFVADRVSILGFNKPAKDVGGDFYDTFRIDDERVFMSIGDVSGKGVPAALMASSCQAVLRILLRQQPHLPPQELVRLVNAELVDSTRPEQFVTLFLAIYSPDSGELFYVNAGHIPPAVLSQDGTITRLEVGGPVVGVVRGADYEAGVVGLRPGDTVFLCSDGVTEMENAQGDQLGEEAVCSFLWNNRTRPAGKLRDELLATLEDYRSGVEQSDDVTFVLIRVG